MNEIPVCDAAFKGSKGISLQDVPSAKATGFGAVADDYMERGIDLNEQLIRNKMATHFFRMTGDAMAGAGIMDGDILIVDRSLVAVNGKVIVAVVDGELLVRRLQRTDGTTWLLSGNDDYKPVVVAAHHSYSVWGVVTYVIHIV